MLRNFFIFCLLVVFLINISWVNLVTNPTYLGWFVNAVYILFVIILLPNIYRKGKFYEWYYIFVMLLGIIFHSNLPQITNLFNESAKWIIIVFLIIGSRKYRLPPFVFYVFVGFFLIHSGITIVEAFLNKNVFDFKYVENFSNYNSSTEFRAFGLMGHPLVAANTLLILMSFIIINRNINRYLKTSLILIGTYSLICVNSRAAMIIWGILLMYKLFFYNRNPIIALTLGLIIYFVFISDLMVFIQQNSNIFGRLSVKNNLSDDSTLTRLFSYEVFWSQRWNFQDIVYGGRIIYLPGTEVSLENGILLTISWWGWFVGIFKVLLELLISFLCMRNYNIKDKAIVMIACWGCAFTNNNSFNSFVFVFFVFSYLAINTTNKIKPKLSQVIFTKSDYKFSSFKNIM